jgi:hypothetical protein
MAPYSSLASTSCSFSSVATPLCCTVSAANALVSGNKNIKCLVLCLVSSYKVSIDLKKKIKDCKCSSSSGPWLKHRDSRVRLCSNPGPKTQQLCDTGELLRLLDQILCLVLDKWTQLTNTKCLWHVTHHRVQTDHENNRSLSLTVVGKCILRVRPGLKAGFDIYYSVMLRNFLTSLKTSYWSIK